MIISYIFRHFRFLSLSKVVTGPSFISFRLWFLWKRNTRTIVSDVRVSEIFPFWFLFDDLIVKLFRTDNSPSEEKWTYCLKMRHLKLVLKYSPVKIEWLKNFERFQWLKSFFSVLLFDFLFQFYLRQTKTKDKRKEEEKKSEVFPFRLLIVDLEFFEMTLFPSEENGLSG